MKYKNIYQFFVILLFLAGCGYKPIFSINNSNFKISKLNALGNKEINRVIESKLDNYKNAKSSNNLYELEISSKLNKNTLSKDTKGNPSKFNLVLEVNLNISKNNQIYKKKKFKRSISYNNSTNKSDLYKYERNIKKNLAEKVTEDIIIFIQSLNNK